MKSLRFLVPCACLLLFGCDSGGSGSGWPDDYSGSGSGLGGQGGDSSTLSIRKVLGKDGGTISIDGASLEFPPGALTGDQEIRVTRLGEAEVSDLPSGAAFASPPVAFEPHGLTFEAPVTVTLDYEAGEGKHFVVAKLRDHGDTTWEKGADGELADGKATFTISSFSIWDVVDDPEGAFEVVVEPEPEPTTTPGSFSTKRLSGLVSLADPGGAVRVTNVNTAADLPYCAAGRLEGADAAPAGLRFDLGQAVTGSTDDDYTPGGSGLEINVQMYLGYEAEIVLNTENADYCYRTYIESPELFIRWDDFAVDCNAEIGAVYGEEPVDAVTVQAISNGSSSTDFYFCVNDIEDGYLGYFENTDFHGFGSVYSAGSGSVSVDPATYEDGYSMTDGVCVDGGSASTSADQAGIEVNLAETVERQAGVFTPGSDGLDLYVTVSGLIAGLPPRVEIVGESESWCARLPVESLDAYEPYFIAWDAFDTNCDGTGTAYGGEDLVSLRVAVEGSEASFGTLCVNDLIDTSAPRVGYFQSGPWHGYPEITDAGEHVTDDNLSWVRSETNACIEGSIPVGSSDYVDLLVPLAQTTKGGAAADVQLTLSALRLRTNGSVMPYASSTAAVIVANDTPYCAPLTLDFYYPNYAYWSSFHDCATGSTPFPGGDISAAGLRIGADPDYPNAFDLCLVDLSESN